MFNKRQSLKTRTKHLLLGLCLTIPLSGQSQELITIYLTVGGQITKVENADCMCDSHYDLENFRLNGTFECSYLNGKPKLRISYVDGVKNGKSEFYYRNGKLSSTGQYYENERTGIWHYFYSNGELKQTVKFIDDAYSRGFDSNIMIGEYYDEEGKQLIKNGTGTWQNDSVYVSFFDRETIKTIQGKFRDSLKHGTWKLMVLNESKPIQTEKFNMGKFIAGVVNYPDKNTIGKALSEGIQKLPDWNHDFLGNVEAFRLDSTVFSDSVRYLDVEQIVEAVTGRKFKIKNRDAGYLFGDLALLEFIAQNIRYPAAALNLRKQGTVIVQLTIDKKNKAKNLKVLTGVYPSLDNEALRIIGSINDWICALHDGEPYEKTIAIPVKFTMH